MEFVISKSYIDFTSLRQGSIHVMHSEFVRSFLNSISILNYVSSVRPWEIESVNHNYTPNTDNMQWKPWHHIYACCGAGKGQSHAPKYNPTGNLQIQLSFRTNFVSNENFSLVTFWCLTIKLNKITKINRIILSLLLLMPSTSISQNRLLRKTEFYIIASLM